MARPRKIKLVAPVIEEPTPVVSKVELPVVMKVEENKFEVPCCPFCKEKMAFSETKTLNLGRDKKQTADIFFCKLHCYIKQVIIR